LKNAAETPRFLLAVFFLRAETVLPRHCERSEAIRSLSKAVFWIASLRSQ
jgi:hypothetical protein